MGLSVLNPAAQRVRGGCPFHQHGQHCGFHDSPGRAYSVVARRQVFKRFELTALRVHGGSAYLPKEANDVVCRPSLAFLVLRPAIAAEVVAEPRSDTQKVTAATDESGQQFGF
jgi:hypothetical protein